MYNNLIFNIYKLLFLNNKSSYNIWIRIVELRYGGLIIRLNSLYDRIKGYLDNKYTNIPEFETPPMMIYENAGPGLLLDYR